MKNAISQDDKKTILNFKEKRRFHQISEQFFRGSHDFFVHQYEEQRKYINQKLVSFNEHYHDAIRGIKDNISDKIDSIKNSIKRDIDLKIMNFIIFLELGVIAASQCPFKLNEAEKFIKKTIDFFPKFNKDSVLFDLQNLFDKMGYKIDFDEISNDITNASSKMMLQALTMFAGGIYHFFNNTENNAFLICFGECAAKIGKTASGAIGIILDLVLSAMERSVAKRPDMSHFAKYGVNPHLMAAQIENESHAIVGIHEKLSFSSSEIGYFDGWDEFRGIVNENDEDPNKIEKFFIERPLGTTGPLNLMQALVVGIHQMKEKNNELDDAKRVLNEMRELREAASKESADTYSNGSYTSGKSILNTASYDALKKKWEDERNKEYDLSGTSKQRMNYLYINEHNASVKSIKDQKPLIIEFYNKHKNSSNPIAQKICGEIKMWLTDGDNKGIMHQKYENYFPVKYFVFAPAIAYAIVEFNHIDKISKNVYEQIDYKLYQLERKKLLDRDTEALLELRRTNEMYHNGFYDDIGDYIKGLNRVLRIANGKSTRFQNLKKLRPDIILSSFKNFPFIVNKITSSYDRIYALNKVNDKFSDKSDVAGFLNGNNTIYQISSKRVNGDENQIDNQFIGDNNGYAWRTQQQMITTISRNHRQKKREIKKLFYDRYIKWSIIAIVVKKLNQDSLYPNNKVLRKDSTTEEFLKEYGYV